MKSWALVWAKRNPNQFIHKTEFSVSVNVVKLKIRELTNNLAKFQCETNTKIIDDEIFEVVSKELTQYDKKLASYEFLFGEKSDRIKKICNTTYFTGQLEKRKITESFGVQLELGT